MEGIYVGSLTTNGSISIGWWATVDVVEWFGTHHSNWRIRVRVLPMIGSYYLMDKGSRSEHYIFHLADIPSYFLLHLRSHEKYLRPDHRGRWQGGANRTGGGLFACLWTTGPERSVDQFFVLFVGGHRSGWKCQLDACSFVAPCSSDPFLRGFIRLVWPERRSGRRQGWDPAPVFLNLRFLVRLLAYIWWVFF